LVDNNPTETESQGDLPPFIFDKPERTPSYIYEIDALNITPRIRNILARAHATEIRKLYDAPDSEILDIRNMGRVSLNVLRNSLGSFRNKVVDERQRIGIEDDTPVALPYPTRPKSGN